MYARIATGIMEENQSGKNGDKKIRGDRNGKILGRKNQGGKAQTPKKSQELEGDGTLEGEEKTKSGKIEIASSGENDKRKKKLFSK